MKDNKKIEITMSSTWENNKYHLDVVNVFLNEKTIKTLVTEFILQNKTALKKLS